MLAPTFRFCLFTFYFTSCISTNITYKVEYVLFKTSHNYQPYRLFFTMKIQTVTLNFHGIYYLCAMIKRISNLSLLLAEFPVVVITGPRQVGKTTLARQQTLV